MKISIKSYTPFIAKAWPLFKGEWGFFIISILIFIIIETVDGLFGIDSPSGSFFITMISGLAGLILTVGFFQAIFRYIDTKKMSFETFFGAYKEPNKVVKYAIGYILMSLIMVGTTLGVGVALLSALYMIEPEVFTDISLAITSGTGIFEAISQILPQLIAILAVCLAILSYLSTRLSFTTYLIIDKNRGPLQALKKSFRITKGKFWYVFFFSLFLTGFNLLGLAFFIIGIAITIPVSIIAYALFYRSLVEHHAFAKEKNND